MLLVSLYLLLLGTESAVLGDLNKWLTKLEEVPSQSSDSNKTDNSTEDNVQEERTSHADLCSERQQVEGHRHTGNVD